MNISNLTSANNAAQEAKETAAQTKLEAAQGDTQAARKLASQKAVSPPQSAPQPANIVESAKGKLDATA